MEIDNTVLTPTLIQGGIHRDDRGSLTYNNEVDLSAIKRFYTIQPAPDKLRGWQGHQIEQKWFTAVRGAVLVLLVRPDDWTNPSFSLKPIEVVLKEGTGDVLHVPAGYATAFKPITPDASIGVFSDLTLEESSADSYRFDEKMWYYETFM